MMYDWDLTPVGARLDGPSHDSGSEAHGDLLWLHRPVMMPCGYHTRGPGCWCCPQAWRREEYYAGLDQPNTFTLLN